MFGKKGGGESIIVLGAAGLLGLYLLTASRKPSASMTPTNILIGGSNATTEEPIYRLSNFDPNEPINQKIIYPVIDLFPEHPFNDSDGQQVVVDENGNYVSPSRDLSPEEVKFAFAITYSLFTGIVQQTGAEWDGKRLIIRYIGTVSGKTADMTMNFITN